MLPAFDYAALLREGYGVENGVRFVRSFKSSRAGFVPSSIAEVFARHRHAPFFILPIAGTTEYAVFRSTSEWSLQDAAKTPIWRLLASSFR